MASFVLHTDSHPTAEDVWVRAQRSCPMVSRATVYNTLNLLVEKGLLRQLALAEGRVVFDPNTARHHHFIDVQSGDIVDVPWDRLEVRQVDRLADLEVDDYQVVLRGRRQV